jgi:hypothetical protein
MSLLKALIFLAYFAWVGELRIARFDGQWRAYLRKPGTLLGVLFAWALMEALIKFFSK